MILEPESECCDRMIVVSRNPPARVKKILRKEVGFGCPVPDCGSPYLEWHHFDPPWSERNHHEPKGMIALCRKHHIEADFGAFTKEQLRNFKRCGRENWGLVEGRFNWMRRDLVIDAGSNLFTKCHVAVAFGGIPLISQSRFSDGYLRVSLSIPYYGQVVPFIVSNDWQLEGYEADVECSPSANRLKVRIDDGHYTSISFAEKKVSDYAERFPYLSKYTDCDDITVAKFEIRSRSENYFVKSHEIFAGDIAFRGCVFHGWGMALDLEPHPEGGCKVRLGG